MSMKDLDDVLQAKNLQNARMLLREFDDSVSAQTRQPVPNPSELRRAGKKLATATLRDFDTAINDKDERVDVITLERRLEAVSLESPASAQAAQAAQASITAINNSRAVALLTDRELLTEQEGRFRLFTQKFGDVKELCPEERFFDRPVSTPATAFLVRKDLVVTLRHNLDFFSGLDKIRVIFNFEMQDSEDEDSCKLEFYRQEIYEVIEHYSLVDDGPHAFIALRLSRPVEDRSPVVCNFGTPIGPNQPVYIIGHPCGLPKIYADNAMVLDASSADAFTANLDAYSGNSASPVFNAETGQVEGLLAEGGDDFQWIPDGQGGFCNFSIVYQSTGPFGYKILRIKKLQQLLGE